MGSSSSRSAAATEPSKTAKEINPMYEFIDAHAILGASLTDGDVCYNVMILMMDHMWSDTKLHKLTDQLDLYYIKIFRRCTSWSSRGKVMAKLREINRAHDALAVMITNPGTGVDATISVRVMRFCILTMYKYKAPKTK
jgi:hypothetical protein